MWPHAVLLKHVRYTEQRRVPISFRTDNASELTRRAVEIICQFLNVEQITTGGHNPRVNVICERVNQAIESMIRMLSDHEYKSSSTLLF
jgi:hypothetical protein